MGTAAAAAAARGGARALVLAAGAAALLLAGIAHAATNPRWTAAEHELARAYGIKEFDLRDMKSLPSVPECADPENADFFARFRTLEEIEDFMRNKLCRLREQIGAQGASCEVREVGRSVEDRPIYAVEIRNPKAIAEAVAAGKPERSILVTGTVHAREWTTTSSVLYSAAHIDVLDVSILLIPVVNPDGYVYTWSGKSNIKKMWTKDGVKGWTTEARLWRKNRARNRDGTRGVDLNRNFGSPGKRIWGTDRMNKSLNITESDVFQGKHGFSEPETATIQRYYEANKDTIVAFYDVHCCIGALLEPYSRSGKAPAYVHDTGKVMLEAINTQTPVAGRYAWRARPQSSASGTGISSSWAYQEAGITFTYVIEIRGKFVSPCREIKPIGLETMYGLAALAGEMSRLDDILREYEDGAPARRKVPSLDAGALRKFSSASSAQDSNSNALESVGAGGASATPPAELRTVGDWDPSMPSQLSLPAATGEESPSAPHSFSSSSSSSSSSSASSVLQSLSATGASSSWAAGASESAGPENFNFLFLFGGCAILLAFFARAKHSPRKRS